MMGRLTQSNELTPSHSRAVIYDDETRLSDDLAQGALAIAASQLRVPQWARTRLAHLVQMLPLTEPTALVNR